MENEKRRKKIFFSGGREERGGKRGTKRGEMGEGREGKRFRVGKNSRREMKSRACAWKTYLKKKFHS